MFKQSLLVLYREVSIVSAVVLAVSFILFLLVSLSLPLIKPIFLFTLVSTAPEPRPLSLATELRFGVWGFCTVNALNAPPYCTHPALGYTIPSYVAPDLSIPPAALTAVQQVLLVILVLHPIAAGLSALPAFFSLFLASHAWSIFTLVLSVTTALVASAALAIDIILVLVAQSELKSLVQSEIHLAFKFGPAFWMVVVATALAWVAVISLSARACYCLGIRRHPKDIPRKRRREHHHDHHDSIDVEQAEQSEKSEKFEKSEKS